MWFNRKSKNRRLEREHVLEVKLRSSQIRAARWRALVLGLSASFGTVLGLWLLWRGGEWALERLVYENKAFALEHLDTPRSALLRGGCEVLYRCEHGDNKK